MPKFEKDFKDLLGLFNKYRVKYCIVGAFAIGFHSIPRYTKDLDILVEPTVKNGERIVKALEEFGFGSYKITPGDFVQPDRFLQLGYEPVRVDLINSLEACSFEQIWRNRKIGDFGGEMVFFIGINELIECKKAAGRRQDLADLETLHYFKQHLKRRKNRKGGR